MWDWIVVHVWYRPAGVLLLPLLDAAGRHELRVRRRCGAWRYLQLMQPALLMPRARQRLFQWGLRRCARRATVADLVEFLDYGWRGRLVAGWLIACGSRSELRPRIARDMSDPGSGGFLHPYCVALACLGTERDARILSDYLLMSLAPEEDEDERHCQVAAMGALLYLDDSLGTGYAEAILGPDGLWARWPGASGVSLEEERRDAAGLVAFARGADPGFRARLGR
ncbi:DUF6000 family protein [Catellatospora chokoriensis]|uniref:Uncharacterized protein n=1 Tax=Catellatospora chokoriensis TaxID=310353 RepID=A0A8J3JMU4_9ACTN|nr:DUF6000 family protein [Catellatospora chokoriensis]GIF87752.1 hypothetical protein Cch02nite_11960 [Catellatospora chokoriensis]